ncbi:MAG: tetratricopeptide repeat protein, partial [Proteobacteria bacterium]|nr:tetratricopeptide repeat protein [Pseudomonadota bacterium]
MPALLLGLSLGFASLPAAAASFLERAQQYFEEGDLRSAAVELKNALQREPGNAAARFLLGRVHLRSGNIAGAEKELLRARDLGYQGEDFDLTLSYLRLRQRRFQDVLTGVSEEIEIENSLQRDLYAARGEALLGLGQFDEASAIFDRILTAGPHAYALLGKARIAMVLGDPETARGHLDRAAELEPDSPDLVAVDAVWLFQARRFEEAKTRFARAVELDPSRLPAYLGQIQSELALGELEAAEGLVRSLAAAQPNNLLVVLQDAIVQFMRGEHRAAKTAADRVLAADDRQPQALLVAGYSAYRLEEYEQAQVQLTAYLTVNPADARARMVLGAALLRLGDSERAYEVVGSSEIEVPDSAAYLGVLGCAAALSGHVEAGLRHLEKAAEKSPEDAAMRARLGAMRMAAGDTAGGIEDLEKAFELSPQLDLEPGFDRA